MDQIFVNTYIEKMSNRLLDNVKNEMMLQTQLEISQQLVFRLQKEIEKLKQEREAYVAAGRADHIEEYRSVCGVIRGLNLAENIINELVQKLEKSDD